MTRIEILSSACALCALTALPLEPVYADLTELTTRPGGADIVDWGQLGTPGLITTPQSFTSVGGITGTVNLNVTPNAFQGLVQQCCVGITGNFNGGFTPGDKVLVTYQAPLTINFNRPVQSVGTQIQDDKIGDHFIAEIGGAFGRPRPGHELVETRSGPQIDELGEHIGEVGLRIDAMQFAGFDE